MRIPTALTLLRLFISPAFLLLYVYHDALGLGSVLLPWILLLLWGVSELSDAFDGYLARRFNQVTDLGKVLDPMADSISHLVAFLTFTAQPVNLPIYLVLLLLYRDSMVSTLRTVCALRGFALAARTSGKVKAIILAITIGGILGMMIPHSLGYLSTAKLQFASLILASVGVGYTVLSGLEYFFAHWNELRKMF
ncbi:MAG: CDP-alcohol phosphatidyltransferase family protein [Chlamydiia bacterium]|nr:CDP-alcohol phosphatidyltransferase family protein [Chlamydiia bacterium]